ncbi:YkgJ family cysteine cluster protein [Roseomonas sp. CCTCC AB2023176]|uniref:YkgJ family cysteine cluster protein n=1 Tax=Roseomonas sp. CCTCC AB2023176 TaxID=3342640 RepID=UPI0035DF741B
MSDDTEHHGVVRGPFEAPHPVAMLLAQRISDAVSNAGDPEQDLSAAHAELYDAVPEFACEPGCTDCCGAIPMSAWEWTQIRDRRHAGPASLSCPYADAGDCAIHAARPLVCRLFGAVEHPRLTCPRGRGPTRKLSSEEGARLMRRYEALLVLSARGSSSHRPVVAEGPGPRSSKS